MLVTNSYRFYCNRECEYFPCHETADLDSFSCQFCFCPLHPYKDCGGQYSVLDNGWKDCSKCLLPHNDYDYIIGKMIEQHERGILFAADKKGTT